MRLCALVALVLAFFFATFGWHLDRVGWPSMMIVGLFFWCLSGSWEFARFRSRGSGT